MVPCVTVAPGGLRVSPTETSSGLVPEGDGAELPGSRSVAEYESEEIRRGMTLRTKLVLDLGVEKYPEKGSDVIRTTREVKQVGSRMVGGGEGAVERQLKAKEEEAAGDKDQGVNKAYRREATYFCSAGQGEAKHLVTD